MKSEEPANQSIKVLRTFAIIAVLLGAAGSLGFTLYTGRNNSSVLLILLFCAWVLSPFMALLVVDFISKRWTDRNRVRLYGLMLVVAVVSLIGYSGLMLPRAKPAFVFLMIPLASWVLLAIMVMVGRRSRKEPK